MRFGTYKTKSSFGRIKGKRNLMNLRTEKRCNLCDFHKKNYCQKSYKKIYNTLNYCKYFKKKLATANFVGGG